MKANFLTKALAFFAFFSMFHKNVNIERAQHDGFTYGKKPDNYRKSRSRSNVAEKRADRKRRAKIRMQKESRKINRP